VGALNWIRIWLKLTALRARELTITEENKKEDKISNKKWCLRNKLLSLKRAAVV
jgi:hypothetical protein